MVLARTSSLFSPVTQAPSVLELVEVRVERIPQPEEELMENAPTKGTKRFSSDSTFKRMRFRSAVEWGISLRRVANTLLRPNRLLIHRMVAIRERAYDNQEEHPPFRCPHTESLAKRGAKATRNRK